MARPKPDPGVTFPRWTIVAAGASVAAAGLAVYANSFFGPFVFDDLLSIPGNVTLHSFQTALMPPGGGLTVSGRPIVNLSLAVNYAISADQVWSYHAANLLIHLLAGLCLFGIIRRTLASQPARLGSPGALRRAENATFVAWAVALLWTVHPLQTESVTYLVQRAESLMGLFYLSTLYCFIRAAESGQTGVPIKGRPEPDGASQWFVGSVVACFLGMATKEVMVSAPVIVLLYDRTFLAGSFRNAWRTRGRYYCAMASSWILLGGLVLGASNRGGTAGVGVGISFWAYGATQFQALAHYLWLSFWPHPLVIDYGVRWAQSVWAVISYALGIGVLLVATLVALARRPAFGFLGAWFFAILAPTALVPGTRQTLAEHRMYLALVPVMVVLVLGLRASLGRRAGGGVLVVALLFACLTVERNGDYRSDEVLWGGAVAARPENAAARNNYGNILSRQGHTDQALVQYAEAIRISPRYAEAYFNAGNALAGIGRLPEAIDRFQEAIVLDPNDAEAHDHLGAALVQAGRRVEGIRHYEAALRLRPSSPDYHNDLGNALRADGRIQEAVGEYRSALRLKPDFAAAHNDLGNAYREGDRQADAIAEYQEALRINPSLPEVRNNLGISLLLSGRTPEAIAQFESALRDNPRLGQVHRNLAIALESTGRSQEAAGQYEQARRLGADTPPGN